MVANETGRFKALKSCRAQQNGKGSQDRDSWRELQADVHTLPLLLLRVSLGFCLSRLGAWELLHRLNGLSLSLFPQGCKFSLGVWLLAAYPYLCGWSHSNLQASSTNWTWCVMKTKKHEGGRGHVRKWMGRVKVGVDTINIHCANVWNGHRRIKMLRM